MLNYPVVKEGLEGLLIIVILKKKKKKKESEKGSFKHIFECQKKNKKKTIRIKF